MMQSLLQESGRDQRLLADEGAMFGPFTDLLAGTRAS